MIVGISAGRGGLRIHLQALEHAARNLANPGRDGAELADDVVALKLAGRGAQTDLAAIRAADRVFGIVLDLIA
jgi:hypothetical protein